MSNLSFSEQVKKQILSAKFEQTCCSISALSAFVRGAGTLFASGGLLGFEIITENKQACDFFANVLKIVYGESVETIKLADKLKGRNKYLMRYLNANSTRVLIDLGIISNDKDGTTINLKIDKYLVENQCCKKAYIIGAFIGGGSLTVPKNDLKTQTGYHLEFVFSNYQTAQDFAFIMSEEGFIPRLVQRKDSWIIYFKNRQDICDLLFYMGAKKSYFELSELMIEKDIRNETNRRINCEIANIEKQVNASISSIASIETIEQSVGLDVLPLPLKTVAIMRKENSESSLSELASLMGISKSCLNHRLRKITEIAKNLDS